MYTQFDRHSIISRNIHIVVLHNEKLHICLPSSGHWQLKYTGIQEIPPFHWALYLRSPHPGDFRRKKTVWWGLLNRPLAQTEIWAKSIMTNIKLLPPTDNVKYYTSSLGDRNSMFGKIAFAQFLVGFNSHVRKVFVGRFAINFTITKRTLTRRILYRSILN